MSNSDLTSAISSLRSEASSLRSEISSYRKENNRMESEINTIENAIYNSTTRVNDLKGKSVNTLNYDGSSFHDSDHSLNTSYDILGQIEVDYGKYKEVESAYKEIRVIKNEIRYKMSEYSNVQKLALALLDNNESNMVDIQAIRKKAEKLYLSTQDYYLSNSLNYIFLKLDGEDKAATRALNLAYKLNKKNTAYFLFLFYYSAKNFEQSKKFFDELVKFGFDSQEDEKILLLLFLSNITDTYKTGYKPLDDKFKTVWEDYVATGRDDTLNISSLIVDDLCQKSFENLYIDKISGSIGEIKVNKEFVLNNLSEIKNSANQDGELYSDISKYVLNSNEMFVSLGLSRATHDILKIYSEISTGEFSRYSANVIKFLLSDCINHAQSDSLKDKMEEIKRLEAIIMTKGDMAQAQTYYVVDKDNRTSTPSLYDNMYKWIYQDMGYNGKDEMEKVAFKTLKNYYTDAYHSFVGMYNEIKPTTYDIAIDDYTVQSKLTNFDNDKQKIIDFYESKRVHELLNLKTIQWLLYYLLAGVSLIGGIILAITGNGGFVFLCIIAVVILSMLGTRRLIFNKNEAVRINEETEKNTQSTISKMKQLYCDYDIYNADFFTINDAHLQIEKILAK